MVSAESVEKQLKKLKFNMHSWGRSEVRELPGILMEKEIIHEIVNGIYDGGFAILVATDIRVLLIDKKPLNYLTVEDFRFDMINEIDYNHRLFGAHINLSAGSKTLKFTSYNQQRLRKLVSHIQHCITNDKKHETNQREDQKNHLEQINQQLQAYLMAQHKHQQELEKHLSKDGKQQADTAAPLPDIPSELKPSPELNDYLFAQSLLAQHKADTAKKKYEDASDEQANQIAAPEPQAAIPAVTQSADAADPADPPMADLYADGMQEVFGKAQATPAPTPKKAISGSKKSQKQLPAHAKQSSDMAALKIAYSKLPMALRNRRFGRPSFHSHSQQQQEPIEKPAKHRPATDLS